jgi:endonuclease/exonuclease/phosphatase family metal-dependent hydrolase
LIHVLESGLRRARRWLSRSEWSLRFLRITKLPEAAGLERGLVMIQIDGLARTQFERALKRGKMPFLRKLMKREGYHLHSIYSGIPSTTAAAQAELFYGIKCAVPAFAYQDRKGKRLMKMIHPDSAAAVETELGAQAEGLFAGGSSYSNIYSGGAAEAHFCASCLGPDHLFKNTNFLGLLTVVGWNLGSVLKLIGLLAVEFVLALYDSLRGAFARGEVRQELLFVLSRVFVCVGLREIITVMASMDVTRGLPVVHLNFNGYDEQSHRRGPASKFAHFSLRGIDNCIKRVWTAAHRSYRRDYDVWIYSDHGQEGAVPYLKENKRDIGTAVAEVLRSGEAPPKTREAAAGGPVYRVPSETYMGSKMEGYLIRGARGRAPEPEPPGREGDPTVVAVGPIGHIYLPEPVEQDRRANLARQLAQRAAIPLVLMADGPGKALAFTKEGRFELPADAVKVLGPRHAFPDECARDLVYLCHHRHAGEFVICGWRPEGRPVTFVWENGSHGGPGYEETRAFGLFPGNAPLPPHADYLRYHQIRDAALHLRKQPSASLAYHRRARVAERTLRVMTYNIHGCGGMDGKLSTARIARVIAHYEPDIVALQESLGNARSNQAREIAAELAATYHFPGASLPVEQDEYGNAVISLYPMRRTKAADLPTLPGRVIETRGALWVSVDFHGIELQFINTHLGLFSLERQKQAEALMGLDWVGHGKCAVPVILCGDFNASPSSPVYRAITDRLHESQETAVGHKSRNSFPGRYPVSRIDHIFCSSDIKTLKVEVPRTHLTRLASDHLPIIAELALPAIPEKPVEDEASSVIRKSAQGTMLRE